MSEDEKEEGQNENASSTATATTVTCFGTSPICAIIIVTLGILRCGAGSSFIFVAFWTSPNSTMAYMAIPFILLPELIEFVYYTCYGKGERDLGPRKNTKMNKIIFIPFAVTIFALFVIGVATRKVSYLFPMYLYGVICFNALETLLLIQHEVNGKKNWTLAASKALVIVANIIFLIAENYYYYKEARSYYYNLKVEGVLAASICICGVLYILHGITFSFGLFKYYSYPIGIDFLDDDIH